MEEILDDILRFLNKYFAAIPFAISDLIEDIYKSPLEPVFKHKLQLTTVRVYLDYLVHKKYIDLYSEEPLNYKINSIGKIFIQTGGFTREKENENNLVRYQRKINKYLIGTALLSALSPLFVELIKNSFFNSPISIKQPIHIIDDSGLLRHQSQRIDQLADTINRLFKDRSNELRARTYDTSKDNPVRK